VEVPSYPIITGQSRYDAVVEPGILARLAEYIPRNAGRVFVTTNEDLWRLHGQRISSSLRAFEHHILFFPPGEPAKRFGSVESAAEEMVHAGGDRASLVVAFGGGIVTDMGGFLAAIFMRGIPVIQIPTTLVAQVDAAVGGKTGVNLVAGKNLIGSFHQPLAVLIDPEVLLTLPDREYRAGLFEVVKHGVIASPHLYEFMRTHSAAVLAREPRALEYIISESVRIKAEVVSADEKEGGLRRILNFGHTFGHALEAETKYTHLLHGEAVGWGMTAAAHLARELGLIDGGVRDDLLDVVRLYGPIPDVSGIRAEALAGRLAKDKKTVKGKVHFVLPDRIGHVVVRADVDEPMVLDSIRAALA
jgi:3-dehydroquinate synthase